MNVPGGVPPQRPDQLLQSRSRSGVGPAPQSGIFIGRLVIVSGTGTTTGVFVYSGTPRAGNPPVFAAVPPGVLTDPYGNLLSGATTVISDHITTKAPIMGVTETLTPGPLLMYGSASLNFVTLTGSGLWNAPAGVTSVIAYGIGGGAGQVEGFGGFGGEFAQDTIGVTPGNNYAYSVGAGGPAGGASPGGNTTFTGDTLTLTAHGASSSAAGSGSTNAIHNNGGAGGIRSGAAPHGGAGGGSAGGPFSQGNPGLTNTGLTGGPGGAAVSGNVAIAPGPGGAGGNNGANGNTPAGFGGGAGEAGTGGTPAAGAAGTLVLQYTTSGTSGLIASMATAAGTDPNTGAAYPHGLYTADLTFGDTVTLFGNQVSIGGATVWSLNNASYRVGTIGQGFAVVEGSNAKQGTATLVAGSVVVANTAVTANSRVFLGYVTPSANAGALFLSALTVGTGFTIKSTNGADTSVVGYEIFEKG